jgi:hypothetical protein
VADAKHVEWSLSFRMNFWDIEMSEWEEMQGQLSIEVEGADDVEDSIIRRKLERSVWW